MSATYTLVVKTPQISMAALEGFYSTFSVYLTSALLVASVSLMILSKIYVRPDIKFDEAALVFTIVSLPMILAASFTARVTDAKIVDKEKIEEYKEKAEEYDNLFEVEQDD